MPYHIISGEKCLELLLDVSGDKIKKKPSSGSNKKETNQSITDLITSSSLKDYNLNHKRGGDEIENHITVGVKE